MSDPSRKKTSRHWEAKIQASESIGAQTVVFDFRNLAVGALGTHRVEYLGGIFGKSLTSTSWKGFRARRPMSFEDLDGMAASIEGTIGVRWHEITLTLLDTRASRALASVTWATEKRATPISHSPLSVGTLKVYYGQRGVTQLGKSLAEEKKVLALETDAEAADRLATIRMKGTESPAIPADALFAFDSAVLRPTAEGHLKKWLKKLNARRTSIVWVEGHTDSVGSHAYNIDLSIRRASAVKDWLVRRRVKDPWGIIAVPLGESAPVASNGTKEGRRRNRRVEIKVM